MRMLHVIAGMDPKEGGVCQGLRIIVSGLSDLNVHNEVVCLDAPNAPFLSQDSFPIYALGPGKGPWKYSSKLIPWLIKNMMGFDGVMVHGIWLYQSYAVISAMRHLHKLRSKHPELQQKKVPKIYIFPQGMLDPYFQRATGRKLKAIRNWIFWKIIESKVINYADGIMFTCETELLLARESFYPYHPKREIVIGMGLKILPFYTQTMRNAFLCKCPLLDDNPYLLFISRIHEKKGVDLLIKAYSEVLKSRNVHLPKLVIAGPGLDTVYGKKIRSAVSENPIICNSVFFPGMLTNEAKWGAFYGCDAFILPSHQENFGIAVVEALACSKPVLISNQVNIWREIEANGGGFVNEDTFEGTQTLLRSWGNLSNEGKKLMQLNALSVYQKYFSIGPTAKRIMQSIEVDNIENVEV